MAQNSQLLLNAPNRSTFSKQDNSKQRQGDIDIAKPQRPQQQQRHSSKRKLMAVRRTGHTVGRGRRSPQQPSRSVDGAAAVLLLYSANCRCLA
jgi:hypothetical protein